MATDPRLDVVPITKGGKHLRSDFLIGRRPVTAREFRVLLSGEDPSAEDADRPMLATTDEAIRYCNRLSVAMGKSPAYDEATGVLIDGHGAPAQDVADVQGFRLPTGAEWDYAARGGRPDPPYADWGAVLDRIYWDDPTSHFANPVPPKEPVTNVIGLVGMLGYVREWWSPFKPGADCRNRVCGWSTYETNYDCFIVFIVTREIAAQGARYPFRIAVSGTH